MPAQAADVPAVLDALVTRIRNLGIECDVDPAKVNAPGVWVKWTGLGLATLAGADTVAVELVAVVPANAFGEALLGLQDLTDDLVDELGHPDGPTRTQASLFPESPVALPSHVLPYLIPS